MNRKGRVSLTDLVDIVGVDLYRKAISYESWVFLFAKGFAFANRKYNKRQEDFPSLMDFNDYLEEVEDMIVNLIEGIDVPAIEARIAEYEKENAEQIMNAQAQKAEELAVAMAASEGHVATQMAVDIEQLEKKKADYAEKMKNKVAMIHKQAEEKRAMVEAKRGEEMLKAEETAAKFRATGQTPKSGFGCFGC